MSDMVIGCGVLFGFDEYGDARGMCGFDGLCPTCKERAIEEEMEETGKTWKQARAAINKYYRGE